MHQVHHEGFKRVIPVMAEHNRIAALFASDPVENAPSQTRAEGAKCPIFRDFIGHDRIGVLGLNPILDADFIQPIGQDMFGKSGLAMIEIAGEQIDRQRPLP